MPLQDYVPPPSYNPQFFAPMPQCPHAAIKRPPESNLLRAWSPYAVAGLSLFICIKCTGWEAGFGWTLLTSFLASAYALAANQASLLQEVICEHTSKNYFL